MTRPELLTVHQVSAQTGLTRKALRLYEEHGLVTPERSAAGYRLFDATALRRLELIRRARALQLGTRDLAEFLDIADGCCERSPDDLVDLVATRLAETDARIAELTTLQATLRATLAQVRRDAETARRDQVHVCTDLLCTCPTTDTGREVKEMTETDVTTTAPDEACTCGCAPASDSTCACGCSCCPTPAATQPTPADPGAKAESGCSCC